MTIKEYSLENFKPWAGAVDTYDKIMEENLANEFEELIDEIFPDGLTEMELNDFLWFEDDYIYESLGIETEVVM